MSNRTCALAARLNQLVGNQSLCPAGTVALASVLARRQCMMRLDGI